MDPRLHEDDGQQGDSTFCDNLLRGNDEREVIRGFKAFCDGLPCGNDDSIFLAAASLEFAQPLAPVTKKIADHLTALGLKNAANHLDTMVHLRLFQHSGNTDHCSGLGLQGTKHQPSNATVHKRPGTHSARLQSNIEIAVHEPVVADGLRSELQRQDFSMGHGIARGDWAIAGPGDYPAILDDHCTHWYFTEITTFCCF